jgi:hypothetical protein
MSLVRVVRTGDGRRVEVLVGVVPACCFGLGAHGGLWGQGWPSYVCGVCLQTILSQTCRRDERESDCSLRDLARFGSKRSVPPIGVLPIFLAR